MKLCNMGGKIYAKHLSIDEGNNIEACQAKFKIK
jgi:hypothetical protein